MESPMITIIPIEPLSDAHGGLIVETFSRLFIDRGEAAAGIAACNCPYRPDL